MGVRCRIGLKAAWARRFEGTRVGTGVARDTLHLEGLKVRVGEYDILEGRHPCKRPILFSWEWKAVQAWDVGWGGDVRPGEGGKGWERLSAWPSAYRPWHGPLSHVTPSPQGLLPLRLVSSVSKKVSCSSQRRSQAAQRKLDSKQLQEQPRTKEHPRRI